ncbi:MAG: archease [Candidatus Aenigmarchaeota archaeon]|nr:archease [Candidatus Aenigmarchaeota archaeon]
MPYKFLEDVAIADVAFEATGKTLEELFESCGLAVTNTMVKDLDSVKRKIVKDIEVESESIELLLFAFLQEIIFYKDAKLLLFNKFDVRIRQMKKKNRLKAKAYGEKLNMKKHELKVDVKAVSLHNFQVKKTRSVWKASVILDV